MAPPGGAHWAAARQQQPSLAGWLAGSRPQSPALARCRVKPNQATFRTVIAALREQGELAEALRVYQGMRRLYPADNSEFEGLTAVAGGGGGGGWGAALRCAGACVRSVVVRQEAGLLAFAFGGHGGPTPRPTPATPPTPPLPAAERAFSSEDADLRSVVAAVCHITSSQSVDLHGMSVLEARAAVLCILAMLQQQYRDSGTIAHDVTIITGRGRGSEGGEPVVRNEVARLLEALFLALPAPAPGDNAGRIVIPQQLLCEAMARKTALRVAQHKLQLPPPQSLLHLHPRYQQQQQQQQVPPSPGAGSGDTTPP